MITYAVCQQCVRKRRWIKREKRMRSCSSGWKAKEAGGVESQTSPRCRHNPGQTVRRQFVTCCFHRLFSAKRREKRKMLSQTEFALPSSLGPHQKARVIEPNYCCKIYMASRAQITHLSRGEMVCQLLPPTLDLSSKDDCGEDGGTKITRRRSCSSKGIQTW